MKKVYLLSLGCARNLVDSEVLLGSLQTKKFDIVQDPESADIAVVNTCCFIEDAKQESIDIILSLAKLKTEGKINKLIVFGCLAQRYHNELEKEIPEIDGIFGTSDFPDIPESISALDSHEKIKSVNLNPAFLYDHSHKRTLLTPPHYAYVKIEEGCSNKCSYCVIPSLKGPLRSRSIESILEEIKFLKNTYDTKEIVLIGQDTTSFARDRSKKPLLTKLLKKIVPIMESRWIRLLYTHPAYFTDDLLDVIAGTDNICSYVDLPLQHINDRILNKMNRRTTKKKVELIIDKIRGKTNTAIRTSVIVGFPGETDKEFAELLDFLKNNKFERLGAFIYSQEENTPAAGFKNQIPLKDKKERFRAVMEQQQKISIENNTKMLNKTIKVLVDERDSQNPEQFIARSEIDAPEVDGTVYLTGKNIKQGDFVKAKITDTLEYDLVGEAL